MSEQKASKLNRLLASLGDSDLVSSRWLQAHGYSRSLVARYVTSGWLVSPARGVYLRKGGRLEWQGVLRSLQEREGLALYVGARFALAMQGYEHYLRLGEAATVTLYGSTRPPGWLSQLVMPDRFEFCGKPPFDWPLSDFTADTQKDQLLEQGLKRQQVLSGAGTIVCSTPKRDSGTVQWPLRRGVGLWSRYVNAKFDNTEPKARDSVVAPLQQHQGKATVSRLGGSVPACMAKTNLIRGGGSRQR